MRPATTLLFPLFLATATFSSTSPIGQTQARHHHHRHATNSTGGTGSCLPHERDALLAFKEAITDDPAGHLASWHEGDEDCCRWRGIRCSNHTGHVVGLHLGHVQAEDDPDDLHAELEETALSGQISPSLLSLHHLEHLDLSMNHLSGPTGGVPEFLGLLQNLRYLNLSGMLFNGSVPPQLGNLSNLHYLDLSLSSDNHPWDRPNLYSDDISWVSNLPLRYLNMESVDLSTITVDWAHVVNRVPSLKVLRLPGCKLTVANQSLPHLNLTDLVELSLSGNDFFTPVASCWFWNLTSLRYLDLAQTYLYGQMPGALGGMTMANMSNLCNLESIDFTNSLFDGNITELLPQCSPNKLNELYLGGNNFGGVLPNWIGRWTSLLILDLSYNGITGHVPSGIGLLSKLLTLKLSNNQFTGPLPSEIGMINTLLNLDLSHNKFTGPVPSWIAHLNNLQTLNLSNNQFIGPVPPEIGLLNNLLTLKLSNNRFAGPVPSQISVLSNLTDIDLSYNNLTGVITDEQLGGLTGLRNIDLSGNSLKIVVDQEWLPPFRLEHASFASCQMGPLFPMWLQSQTHILELNIASASIFDRLPDWFVTTFSNSLHLDISNNGISGTLPTDLENMTSLQRLYLNSNNLSGPIPQLPVSLWELDISENSLSGTLPSTIGSELAYLNLASNRFSGPISQSFCQLMVDQLNLANNDFNGEFPCSQPWGPRVLILRNNSFSGKFPSFLKTRTDQYVLDLAWNKFSGRIPVWIGDLAGLTILQLSHNEFTGSIPSTITSLTQLSLLNLADNSISGPLPQNLSNLMGMTKECILELPGCPFDEVPITPAGVNLPVITKGQERYYNDDEIYEMVSIDLSSNQLTGRIPEELSYLDGVINLNLSCNQLIGEIPNKIGGMESLESLDLSKNKIYGEIPQSLSNLTYLSYLDLSYNNLTGRIPSGGQLDTLYAQYPSMYDSNNRLCGHPLPKNCSSNSETKHSDHKGDEHDSQVLSFSFALGIGYVVGLWVVFCVILFKRPWRIAFFYLFDKAFEEVCVFVFVKWARWAKRESKHYCNW